jgi:hypothetical protein
MSIKTMAKIIFLCILILIPLYRRLMTQSYELNVTQIIEFHCDCNFDFSLSFWDIWFLPQFCEMFSYVYVMVPCNIGYSLNLMITIIQGAL